MEIRSIIRIKTETYISKGTLVTTRRVYPLLRKSTGGFHYLTDEIENVGTDVAIEDIHTAPDGIYQIYVKWYSRDIDTGYVDDVLYGLKPYIEGEESCQKNAVQKTYEAIFSR